MQWKSAMKIMNETIVKNDENNEKYVNNENQQTMKISKQWKQRKRRKSWKSAISLTQGHNCRAFGEFRTRYLFVTTLKRGF